MSLPVLLSLEQATPQLRELRFSPISFEVKAQEKIAILGPSGAGKSSLLRMLASEYRLATGLISFQGRALSAWDSRQLSKIRAVLPQSYDVAFALESHLIISLGRIARAYDPERDRIIEQAAQLAKADHLLTKPFHLLSGGEKARVQLARIFAQLWDQPNGLLLIDEPVAALDPGLQLEILSAINTYATERQHAVLTVLHDMNHALMYFDRILLMKDLTLRYDISSTEEPLDYFSEIYGISIGEAFSVDGQRILYPLGRQTNTI